MSGVNKVIVLGRLGQDPEIRYMTSGDAVCNLSVATSEEWKDKATGERKQSTEWHKVVMYRALAEIAAKYLKKGAQVYIEGKLKTRKWDKDGVDHYTTEIIADELQMLGGKSEHGDAPQYEAPVSRGAQTRAQPLAAVAIDDDIPF